MARGPLLFFIPGGGVGGRGTSSKCLIKPPHAGGGGADAQKGLKLKVSAAAELEKKG